MMRKNRDGDKPSVEEKMGELSRDPNFAEIIADPDDDKFENELTLKFRNGARRECAKAIWKSFKSIPRASKPKDLAAFFKLTRPQDVTKLESGLMTFETLIALLSDRGWSMSQLEPLPSLAERAIAGYQLAIYWLKTRDMFPRQGDRFFADAPSLLSVSLLLSDPEYVTTVDEARVRTLASDNPELESELWDRFAARVHRAWMTSSLKDTAYTSITGPKLKVAVDTFAAALTKVRRAVPHQWIPEL